AAARGLLVMGPDCGTAIIGGVGFGFANRVRRGSIGLVAASGHGFQGLDASRRAPRTGGSAVISKPPAPEVAERLVGAARRTGKPVVLDLIGEPSFGGRLGNLYFAAGLEDTAEIA